LTSQVLSAQVSAGVPALDAWVGLLRAHAALTRELNADLVNQHGLTINDYEVLLHLARAEGRRLRRVDLAERLILTASGITRLLDGLERAGYVEKGRCESDARVTYAVLTKAGLDKLREAGDTHVGGIRSAFELRFTEEELATLGQLLARLPLAGSPAESCTAEPEP
jgi:DNA-binding MarR family transcriptional regulator